MRVFDDSSSVGSGLSQWSFTTMDCYTEGSIGTKHGYVQAYAEDSDHLKVSTLRFIWKGRLHIRAFTGKAYTRRGLVMKAKQFANEVATRNSHDRRTRRSTTGAG